jgi:hypothetical protein
MFCEYMFRCYLFTFILLFNASSMFELHVVVAGIVMFNILELTMKIVPNYPTASNSLHHVVSVLPHHTMTELCRRHGPVMYLRLGEIPTVVVSSAKAVAEMMKANDASFVSRRTTGMQDIVGFGGSGIVFAPYGDHWRQMRMVCVVELVSSKQVKRMDSMRAEEMGKPPPVHHGLAWCHHQCPPEVGGAEQRRRDEGGVRRQAEPAGGFHPRR